jgi:hypothetical protein
MRLPRRTQPRRSRPFVVVVWSAPPVRDGVISLLDGAADVRGFRSGSAGTLAFLRLFNPDVVVIDTVEEADAAIEFVGESGAQLVRVDEPKLQVFGGDGWEQQSENGVAPLEAIQGLILGRTMQGAT